MHCYNAVKALSLQPLLYPQLNLLPFVFLSPPQEPSPISYGLILLSDPHIPYHYT